MGKMATTLLTVKCVGDGCRNTAEVKGPEALTITDIKFLCNECKCETKHKLKAEKAKTAHRFKDGQMQLDVEVED